MDKLCPSWRREVKTCCALNKTEQASFDESVQYLLRAASAEILVETFVSHASRIVTLVDASEKYNRRLTCLFCFQGATDDLLLLLRRFNDPFIPKCKRKAVSDSMPSIDSLKMMYSSFPTVNADSTVWPKSV